MEEVVGSIPTRSTNYFQELSEPSTVFAFSSNPDGFACRSMLWITGRFTSLHPPSILDRKPELGDWLRSCSADFRVRAENT